MNRLLSIYETCQILGVGRTSVYELLRQKKLESCHIGRRHLVKSDSVVRLLEEADL